MCGRVAPVCASGIGQRNVACVLGCAEVAWLAGTSNKERVVSPLTMSTGQQLRGL